MIIVHLMGGLGNQMFQYAKGRRIAKLNNVQLKLDTGWFTSSADRAYGLNHFCIDAKIASGRDIEKFFPKRWTLRHIIRIFERRRPYFKKAVVFEQACPFDPNTDKIGINSYLIGYWQSQKNFAAIEREIRQDFKLAHPLDRFHEYFASEISRVNSVSMHIRRGDYVSNPMTSSVHGVCSLEYYRSAQAIIADRVKNPVFFVFSDDPEWVQDNLYSAFPFTVVADPTTPGSEAQDLCLMALCKHNIIANSSFSWWGAWLNQNPGKVVIAPAKWFKSSDFDSRDIIPESWIKN
ncbi:MAG: alpha-1,2-fucosyltransferase [Candidatus Riflebacteria bacterium]|nr:alpha-1,2-fucosyltransferase [Candidatus Riflebacteria bacterium]